MSMMKAIAAYVAPHRNSAPRAAPPDRTKPALRPSVDSVVVGGSAETTLRCSAAELRALADLVLAP